VNKLLCTAVAVSVLKLPQVDRSSEGGLNE